MAQQDDNVVFIKSGLKFVSELAHFTPRQKEAIVHLDSQKTKFLLYGGALGGGKSYFLRWYGIRRLLYLTRYLDVMQPVGMLACEDYPSLKDRQLTKIGTEVPPWLGKLHEDHKLYGRCLILNPKWGGGILCFRNLDDPSKYASAEFAFILVDELTKNVYDVFTHLRTRLRWPGVPDIQCQFVAGSNPGSIGHGWVKQLWMDKVFPEEFYSGGIDYRTQFAYVPSKANDNPYLDEAYWAMLDTIPEQLRKAFRDGDWDVFVGQAFPEIGPLHFIEPIPIPQTAPLYMTFDWGYGKPFSVGWWWVDNDGRVYRFSRWYGCSGTPDEGLRLADSQIAEGIKEREERMGLAGKDIIRLAGPDCWNKKPSYDGKGQGPPTAEVFAQYGLYLIKGDPNREVKIRQLRERLRLPLDGNMPMMMVYNTDEEFKRCMASLIMDKNNIEDVDTKGEDHIYDEVCHIVMARPMKMPKERQLRNFADIRIDAMEEIVHDDTDVFINEFARENIVWDNILTGNDEQMIAYTSDME